MRVRARFLSGFAPEGTQVLRVPDGLVRSLALRPAPDGVWVEHFYLNAALQGCGVGTGVLSAVTGAADATGTTLRLDVLQRSAATPGARTSGTGSCSRARTRWTCSWSMPCL